MVAVLDALGLRRVDVYGDSYGSFAAQTLALRHPERVRSLVLDGTYPLDFDPWARDALAALRGALRDTCRRSPTCPWRRRDASERVATLARSLRAHPLITWAREPGGKPVRVRLDDRGLAGVLATADAELAIYRDFPAAVEAFDRGDSAPLARLASEAFTGGANGPALYYSAGLDAAVECHDYPQLFDLAAPPGVRLAQLAARLGRLPADVFAPFDRSTWFGADLESYDWCVRWPAPVHAPDPPRPPGAAYPDCRRSCSTATSTSARRFRRARGRGEVPEQHARRRAQSGPRHRARRRPGCAAGIVRRFIATTRVSGTACAAENPPLHLVARVPAHVGDGSRGDVGAGRRVVPRAASRRLVRDARGGRRGRALPRGPRDPRRRAAGRAVHVRGAYLESHPVTFRLRGVRFCADVAVSG